MVWVHHGLIHHHGLVVDRLGHTIGWLLRRGVGHDDGGSSVVVVGVVHLAEGKGFSGLFLFPPNNDSNDDDKTNDTTNNTSRNWPSSNSGYSSAIPIRTIVVRILIDTVDL